MNPLSSLSKWPVDNVAAALVAADGIVETFGDTAKVFPVASLTKLVSAYGIMMAVEEGAVELDGAAGPEGATLRHLLAHASGVGFDSRESQKPVGERRIYSSAGYEWAADTVAEACEMDFADYLTEGVLEPLGMRDTALRGLAGHGLHSSVQDLAEFAREVLRPQLLSAASVNEMQTVQFDGLRGVVPGYGMQKPCPWGLGFEIKGQKAPHWTGETMPPETVGHFGMSGTYLWVAGDYAMIALTDRDFGDWAKPLWAETNDAVWGALD